MIEKLKNSIHQSLQKLLGYKETFYVPPGHYYSPIVSKAEITKREHLIWTDLNRSVDGIDLNEISQVKLMKSLYKYYSDLPFQSTKEDGFRYFFSNEMYSFSDGIFMYSMLRHFKPKRIIEIGSGYSSALMLDVNEMYFDGNIDLTFIEPYPERLLSLVDKKSIKLIDEDVQDIDLKLFDSLEENDILFIDSTHVVKTGSDVNFILFNILPRLKVGVKIHFHDIFYPFEYPKEWVIDQGRSWNENYFLRSFLSYNQSFEIVLFIDFLHKCHGDWLAQNMPLSRKNTGGSIWINVKEKV